MRSRSWLALTSVSLVLFLATPSVASAQFGLRRLVGSAIDRLLNDRTKCVFNDLACVEEARAENDDKPAVLTDEDGEVIMDDDGQPMTDPAAAAAKIGAPDPTAPPPPAPDPPASDLATSAPPPPAAAPTRPAPADPIGTGVWVDYDFVPGDRVLFYDDFSGADVGGVPGRFEPLAGDWDVAEWDVARYLRATSSGTISIELPETLPERFTVEFPAAVQHDVSYVRLSTAPILHADRDYAGSAVSLEPEYSGIRPIRYEGPNLWSERREGTDQAMLVTLRVMADGSTMKVYLDDHLVANAPDAVFPRTSTLFFTVASANPAMPVLIGPVRVSAAGAGIPERLETEGRVATQGIVFEANSDVIRPESTPTLKAVADLLAERSQLRLSIEAHTGSEQDEGANLELSSRRAEAVKSTLVSTFGVAAVRLEAEGLGNGRPVVETGTLEGREQNQRVEFVRLN